MPRAPSSSLASPAAARPLLRQPTPSPLTPLPLAALTTLREGGIDGDEEQRRQLGGDGAAQGVRGDARETISLRVAGG